MGIHFRCLICSRTLGNWYYSQRNWVEVFYREAKGWLGLKEYQVIPLLQNHTTVARADRI
jgi:hypothetical protein